MELDRQGVPLWLLIWYIKTYFCIKLLTKDLCYVMRFHSCHFRKENRTELVSIHSLARLLTRQTRLGTTHNGSGNKAENYSSISATNQH